MKKITALLIILLIIFTVMPVMGELNQNFFNNPGFETIAGDRPASWAHALSAGVSGVWGDTAVVCLDKSYNDPNSIKLVTDTYGKNPTLTQTSYSMHGQAEYEFSVWVYTESLDAGSYAAIKVDMYDASRKPLGSAGKSVSKVTNSWQKLTETFTTETGCAIATFQLRLIGAGVIYFDNASAMQTKEPEFMDFDTDQVFYYSDEEESEGALKVSVNEYYEDLISGGSASFKILYRDTVIYTAALNIPLTNREASAAFPISALAVKKREYKAEVVVSNSEGQELSRAEKYIYKFDRPSFLRSDGTYLKNGKEPFDPVFAYHVSTDHYGKCKEAGINVVQSNLTTSLSRIGEYLDAAAENGIMVLLTLYNGMLPAGNTANADFTMQVVETYQNHPALFAYAIMDEPFLSNSGIGDDLRKSYKLIRQLDDKHPVYLVEGSASHYEEAAKYADIFAIDPYPANAATPITCVTTAMEKAMAAAKGRKPVYALLQTFRNNGYLPTGNEVRHMMYQALYGGARAVGFFSYSDADLAGSVRIPMHDLASWESLTSFYQKEKSDAYDVFVHDRSGIIEYKTVDVLSVDYTKGRERYRILLNLKNEEKTVLVPTAGAGTDTNIELINGSVKSFTSEADEITFTLSGCAAVKMRLVTLPQSQATLIHRKDGFLVTSLSPGDIKARLYFKLDTGGKKVTLYTGLYKKTSQGSRLIEIKCSSSTAAPVGVDFIENTITVADTTEYYIKSFALGEDMSPLTEAEMIECQ